MAAMAAMAVCGAACAAGANANANADIDALSLKTEEPEKSASPAMKLFVEGALAHAEQRYGLGSRTLSRATLDFWQSGRPAAALQGVVSARVDATQPEDPRIDAPAVLSLREAYIGWQDGAGQQAVDIGRINLREGPGYGYNPTDFYRDYALRTITAVNPFTLREIRMGSVMLRAQQLWSDGSLALVFSPRLACCRSTKGWSVDLGSTNARDRGSLSLNSRWSEKLNTQLLAYKEDGAPVKFGASLTALVSEGAVVHVDWSTAREVSLLSRALALPAPEETGQRFAAGLTYTTSGRLSVTAELQYNGFAADRSTWQSVVAGQPAVQASYFQLAQDLQDNASRQAWLLYAVQRDLVWKGLDLTALVKFNLTDSSRLLWLDLRYRLDKMDLAFQVQQKQGVGGSEFGSPPTKTSGGVVATLYF